jgi:hypothetical protein
MTMMQSKRRYRNARPEKFESLDGRDMGRSYTWPPLRPKRISDPPHATHIDPIATRTYRTTPANLREPTLANLRRIRANAALRSRPIENDPRYADVECQDEEFSRSDAG